MTINICVAGATGWTGSAVTRAVLDSDDFSLSGAVARASEGRDIGEVLGLESKTGVTVQSELGKALDGPTDVLVDYTSSGAVKGHVFEAIEHGVAVVVGTSGLGAGDYEEIAGRAEAAGVGVVASGNFSLTACLMQHLALIAARHVPQWEVVDYASAGKEDVPSGTARELAEKLADVRKPEIGRPVALLHGPTEARGAAIDGVQVHSLRLPGFTLRCEAVFGMPGERLTVSHEAGPSADPYVLGTLLAARKAPRIKGLVRGLDTLLFDQPT